MENGKQIRMTSSEISHLWAQYMNDSEWFNIMIQNNWLEQPPLAPNRMEIAKEK